MLKNCHENLTFRKLYYDYPSWAAAIWTIACGVFIHLFRLVTPIHNYDDIGNFPSGFGSGVSSGRWFLYILGDWAEDTFGNYNIPLFKGFLYIVFIGMCAGLIVSIFQITSRKHAILTGLALVSFPTVSATMLFMFTASYYGLAVLLAVLAVWILPRYKAIGFILSATFTALALGIYQAFLPVTAAIFVLQLLQQSLRENSKPIKIILQGIYDCFSMAAGVILYFICNAKALMYYNTSLSDYRGISEMGKLSLSELPELIWRAFSSVCLLPINDYAKIAQTPFLKVGYLLIYILSVALVVYCLAKKKDLFASILALGLLLIFPVAVNLMVIMGPNSWIYSLMVFSFALLICMPVVIWEAIPVEIGKSSCIKQIFEKIASVLIAFLILGNSYMANVNYNALYYTNRHVENYLSGLVAQVRMTEGFTPEKKWVFQGNINDPLLRGMWHDIPVYGGNIDSAELLNAYSRKTFVRTYLGYAIPFADNEEYKQVKEMPEYQNMPCWPASGSIRVIDDYVVIKLEE